MANKSFSASIDQWVLKTKQRAEAVFHESTERVVEEMQKPMGAGGRMRVDTGFLRASLLASTSQVPAIRPNARPIPGQSYNFDMGPISLVINGADLGATIYAGYVAGYAGYREYGANGQAPDAFVRTAAAKWPQIVSEVVRDVKARVK